MPNSGKTARSIVWAIVALFVATMAATVALFLVADDATVAATLVTSLLGSLGTIAAVLVTLAKTSQVADSVRRVEGEVEEVSGRTHDLVNGLLDAKVRAGVAEVLHPNLVDPAIVDQVVVDKVTRAEGRAPGHAPDPMDPDPTEPA